MAVVINFCTFLQAPGSAQFWHFCSRLSREKRPATLLPRRQVTVGILCRTNTLKENNTSATPARRSLMISMLFSTRAKKQCSVRRNNLPLHLKPASPLIVTRREASRSNGGITHTVRRSDRYGGDHT